MSHPFLNTYEWASDYMDEYAIILFLQCSALTPPSNKAQFTGYTPWVVIGHLSINTGLSTKRILSLAKKSFPYILLHNDLWGCCYLKDTPLNLPFTDRSIPLPVPHEALTHWPRSSRHARVAE
jgi:hypothetical protein